MLIVRFLIFRSALNNMDRNFDIDVVMDLSEISKNNSNNNISYRRHNIDIFQQNKWFTYKNTLTYKKEMWKPFENQCHLKIYLWNLDHLEGYIDDIQIKVKTIM
jgi:hypothetical protein